MSQKLIKICPQCGQELTPDELTDKACYNCLYSPENDDWGDALDSETGDN